MPHEKKERESLTYIIVSHDLRALAPLVDRVVVIHGTSSVLYGSVADYVTPEHQSRAFGIFYTVVIASGAVSPVACGVLSDFTSLNQALAVVAVIALLAIPLSLQLKPATTGLKGPTGTG